ncbi:hypothetical protein TrVFT333_000055 [Trichoderma virens FT-333]|nr:hypothetical protein TrVFT333_000055 [Trichoderma virens FT-333]
MGSGGKETVNDDMIRFFLDLHNEEQDCMLEKYLVQDEPRLALCQSERKLDLMRRAREMFYSRNEFLLWWHGLGDFLSCVPTGTIEGCTVDLTVRNVTVRYDMSEDQKEWRGKDLVTELEKLFCLTNANSLRIEIIGGGTPNGSDIRTQLLLKDICSIVKRLIAHFGTRFEIQKGSGELALLPSLDVYPLTPYWKKPESPAREKWHKGVAEFTENMQVQVESWLSESIVREGSNEPKDWGMVGRWETQDSLRALFADTGDWFLSEGLLLQDDILPPECILPQESLLWEALL